MKTHERADDEARRLTQDEQVKGRPGEEARRFDRT